MLSLDPRRAPATEPSPAAVRSFALGMPEAYRVRHVEDEIRAHAVIAAGRGAAPVVVESCAGPSPHPDGGEWLCVIADDRPGLLSYFSAALSAHSLDILSARVYSRARVDQPAEAIDLFAVRRLNPRAVPGPLSAEEIAAIRSTIAGLLAGDTELSELEKHGASTSRPTEEPPTTVYFSEVRHRDLLVVETGDRPGLLLAITLAIHKERASIVRSSVATFAGIARDEFEVTELDGQRLTAPRRAGLVNVIYACLDQEHAVSGRP